jgi:hypothetical protein
VLEAMGGAVTRPVIVPESTVSPTKLQASKDTALGKFYDVKMISHRKEANSLHLLTFQVPKEIYQQYLYPGQYVKIKLKHSSNISPVYLAICSCPSEVISNSSAATSPASSSRSACLDRRHFSFLVKDIPIHNFLLTRSLYSSFSSTDLSMSPPLGNGFNLRSVSLSEIDLSSSSSNSTPSSLSSLQQAENVLLFATGTGIGAILPIIEMKLIPTKAKIKLYYGVRSSSHIPFSSKLLEWSEKGIMEVVTVFSGVKQKEVPLPSLSGEESEEFISSSIKVVKNSGYVQNIFQRDVAASGDRLCNPNSTIALLCGQR